MSYATRMRKPPRSSFFGDAPLASIKMSPIYVKSPPFVADGDPITTGVISSAPIAEASGFQIPNVVWWGAAAAAAYWLWRS